MTLDEWNDGRLDELARRVEGSATKGEMRTLQKEVERTGKDLRQELKERADSVKDEVKKVGGKVESIMGDPAAERRARNQGIQVAIVGAAAGGFFTFIIFILSGNT